MPELPPNPQRVCENNSLLSMDSISNYVWVQHAYGAYGAYFIYFCLGPRTRGGMYTYPSGFGETVLIKLIKLIILIKNS